MSKSNSCIYLLCRFPMFNPDEVPLFASFDRDNSALLYSSLLLNYIEVLDSASAFSSFYVCLDHKDKDFLPAELQNSENLIWIDSTQRGETFKKLNSKYFTSYPNNIIISADSIGVSGRDIKKIINLLSSEDNTAILGKTYNEKICSIGFNVMDLSFFADFGFAELDYNKALNAACRQDVHLHTINNFLVVETPAEFKKLYQELSKKESLAYCSQTMHEKFTALFIEYKELLK